MVLDNTTVTLDKHNYADGTLLFTGSGISGPAALDLSGRAAKALGSGKEVVLKINFRNDYTRNTWLDILNKVRQHSGKKLLHNALANLLPHGLLCNIIEAAGASEVIASQINKNTLERLLDNLSAMPCKVSAVENWEKAMASTGGVSRNAVNAKSMQCKLYPNLYFAGEFIDVDGPCGGYNIQWALSSGYCAGQLKAARS
jgi:predicted Rossmann fold flavoprotein